MISSILLKLRGKEVDTYGKKQQPETECADDSDLGSGCSSGLTFGLWIEGNPTGTGKTFGCQYNQYVVPDGHEPGCTPVQ